MLAADVLERLSACGVRLMREGDALVATPRDALNDELRTLIRAHKPELLAALGGPEVFVFTPPSDPASAAEGITERAAIMAVENGWSEATALQEARWHADRERCWGAFLRNAQRVLEAPEPHREALLARYREEAARRYSEATARDMTASLRSWINARGVH